MAFNTDFSALEIEGLCNEDTSFLCHQCSGVKSMHHVTICVEAKSIYVCGHVLSIASPVFKAMIIGDFKEGKERKIKLPGKTYKGIVLMLKCIYPNSLRQVTDEIAYDLLPLAEEYQIEALRERCMERLIDQAKSIIQTDTLYKLLSLALKFTIPSLKIRCVYLLSHRKLAELSESQSCYEIPEKINKDILKVTIQRYELERDDESRIQRNDMKNSINKIFPGYRMMDDAENCASFLQSLRLTHRFFRDDKQMLIYLINADTTILSKIRLNSAKLKPKQMPYYDETYLDTLPGSIKTVLLEIQELCLGGDAAI